MFVGLLLPGLGQVFPGSFDHAGVAAHGHGFHDGIGSQSVISREDVLNRLSYLLLLRFGLHKFPDRFFVVLQSLLALIIKGPGVQPVFRVEAVLEASDGVLQSLVLGHLISSQECLQGLDRFLELVTGDGDLGDPGIVIIELVHSGHRLVHLAKRGLGDHGQV